MFKVYHALPLFARGKNNGKNAKKFIEFRFAYGKREFNVI